MDNYSRHVDYKPREKNVCMRERQNEREKA